MNEFQEILQKLDPEGIESLLRSARLLKKIQDLGIKSPDALNIVLSLKQADSLPEAERKEIIMTVITLCNHLTPDRLEKAWDYIYQLACEQKKGEG